MAPKTVTITIDTGRILQWLAETNIEALTASALKDAAEQVLLRAIVPPGASWRIRSRVASRQSCLWRHSFNWRDRKRGHPVHR